MSKRSNGEGTLRKRKDGRWEGRYNAGVDENGKKKVKYILAKSQAECKEKLRAAIAEYNEEQAMLARCDFLNNPNPTLKEWSEIWLENFCKAAVRQGTYENYKFFFRTYINPSLGSIELKSLSTVNCQQFLMKMFTEGRIRGKENQGLSARTVRDIKIALHSCLQKAVDEELISKNPCSKVKLPEDKPKEMKTLSANNLAAFLNEARESDCYELYYLVISTGMRRGEILALEWNDIDFKAKTISVSKQLQRTPEGLQVSPPKTKSSIRKISISDECVNLLKVMRGKQRLDQKLLFPSPITDGYRDPDAVTRKLHRMLRRAGLPDIRFHDLRHSFATLSLEQGMDIKTVSHMLGHTDAGFTMNTYMHVTDAMQQNVADTMSNLISEKEQEKRESNIVKFGT